VRVLAHLTEMFGATRITSPAYQKWSTRSEKCRQVLFTSSSNSTFKGLI